MGLFVAFARVSTDWHALQPPARRFDMNEIWSVLGAAVRVAAAVLGAVLGLAGALCLLAIARGYAPDGRMQDKDAFWWFVMASVVPLALGRALALGVQGRWTVLAAVPTAAIGAIVTLPTSILATTGIAVPRDPYLLHALEAAVWYLVPGVQAAAVAVVVEVTAAVAFGTHRTVAVVTVLGVNLAQLVGATMLVMAAAWPAEGEPWGWALVVVVPWVVATTTGIAGGAAVSSELWRFRRADDGRCGSAVWRGTATVR
jgi:hypothetical protein